MMNIFRFVGDMSHLASFFLLLAKLIYTKSSTGEPSRTRTTKAWHARARLNAQERAAS